MAFISEEHLICPITLDIMNDPVICEDGYTFEKKAILQVTDNKSPLTRQQINLNKLIPNRIVKNIIDEYNKNKKNIIVNYDMIIFNEYIIKLNFERKCINIEIEIEQSSYKKIISENELINIKSIDKFYLMLNKALNKESNYNIDIKLNDNDLIFKITYFCDIGEFEENIVLNKINREEMLQLKIKKLEFENKSLFDKLNLKNYLPVTEKLFSHVHNNLFLCEYDDIDESLIDIKKYEPLKHIENLIAVTHSGKMITNWKITTYDTLNQYGINNGDTLYQYHIFPMLITSYEQIKFLVNLITPIKSKSIFITNLHVYDGCNFKNGTNKPTEMYIKRSKIIMHN